MAEAVTKTEVCASCGTEIRKDTQFCYSCGTAILQPQNVNGKELAPHESKESKEVLEDLAKQFQLDPPIENAELAKTAAKRRKSRVAPNRTKEYVWEPNSSSAGLWPLLVALIVLGVTAAIVFFAVYWK